MRATAKVTSKGQVTIPANIRQKYGLRAGVLITFVDTDGRLSVLPEEAEESVFEKWRGIGNPGLPTGRKALLEYMHEMRGHDEFDRQ